MTVDNFADLDHRMSKQASWNLAIFFHHKSQGLIIAWIDSIAPRIERNLSISLSKITPNIVMRKSVLIKSKCLRKMIRILRKMVVLKIPEMEVPSS